MKNILAITLATIFLFVGDTSAQTATPPSSGDGTPGDPYQIATLENLYWLTVSDTAWSRHFIQTANINGASSSAWNDGLGFSPIGNTTTAFTGNYDGQGHSIDSIHIDRGTWGEYQGMFGYTNAATISNLGLTNVSVVCGDNSAALIGFAYNNTTVNECYASGSVASNGWYVGGLVGVSYFYVSIRNSFSACSVTGDDKIGGLVGRLWQYSTVSHCYSRGIVFRKVSGAGTEIGAFCGRIDNSTISDSYTTGNVVYLGGTDPTDNGFVGTHASGTLSNNFCDTTASNQTAATGATVKTTEEMKTPWVYVTAGWDFELESANGTDDDWDMDEANQRINDGYAFLSWQNGAATALTVIASAPASGDGTSGTPYTIASVYNLYWLTLSDTAWSRYFIQTADINAGGSSEWDGGSGLSPIGNTTTYFTGNYNGQRFGIDSMHINRPGNDFQAMFGATDGATISNLGVTNVSVGGAGQAAGLIGFAFNHTNVDNCQSSGAVSCVTWYAGGIAGLADYYCAISNSISTCSVTVDDFGGGLVGRLNQYSTAANCYTRGTVFRNESGTGAQIGAFCGYMMNSTISTSYTTGSVVYLGGTDPTDKGFVGSGEGTLSNNFCDTTASNQTAATGATVKTTQEMKMLSTYITAGWDFVLESSNGTNDNWDLDTTSKTVNNGYPFLAWENGEGIALPVQLVGMKAAVSDQRSEVTLSWSTASETDNAGWEVERREASMQYGVGSREKDGWVSIGFVEGAGTATSPREYVFTDAILNSEFFIPNSRFAYRLKQIDRSGTFSYSHEAEVEIGLAPKEFTLGQNYPNPFNPTTTITFTLPTDGRATLRVIDILGREVATIWDGEATSGKIHQATFDGAGLSSGVYFARLETGGKSLIGKMHLLK